MIRIDREGIFKAAPMAWSVQTNEKTQSVAVNIDFQILEQLDGDQWVSWAEYEPHSVSGWFYVVKKDGTINDTQVEQLVKSLGWDGDLRLVTGAPPNVVAQVNVKADDYDNKRTYKVAWINPEDYTPSAGGVDDNTLNDLQNRYGSLLRACASSVKGKGGPPLLSRPTTSKPPAPTEPPSGYKTPPVAADGDGDLPF